MKTLDDILDEFYEEELIGVMGIGSEQCGYLLGKLDDKIENFYKNNTNWELVDDNENFQDILMCLMYDTDGDSSALISVYTYDRDLLACQYLMGKSVHSNYKLKELKMAETIMS